MHAERPALPSDDKRWRIVNTTMRRHGYARHALIETLHTVQQSFGSLDPDSIAFVAGSLGVPLSQAYGVATFYHFFTLRPPGEHTCLLCLGTACYIKGAGDLMARAEAVLGVKAGETTADGKASLVMVRCLGSCSVAPVAVFDDDLAGSATAELVGRRLEAWLADDA